MVTKEQREMVGSLGIWLLKVGGILLAVVFVFSSILLLMVIGQVEYSGWRGECSIAIPYEENRGTLTDFNLARGECERLEELCHTLKGECRLSESDGHKYCLCYGRAS